MVAVRDCILKRTASQQSGLRMQARWLDFFVHARLCGAAAFYTGWRDGTWEGGHHSCLTGSKVLTPQNPLPEQEPCGSKFSVQI